MHTYTPENSVSDGLIRNLLSAPCIAAESLSPVHVNGEESLNGFRSGTFVGLFPSDGAAGMAVKGLKTQGN